MQKIFETSSFYLAAFLRCRGAELLSAYRTGHGSQKTFVFRDRPDRSRSIDAFLLGKDDQVSAREYMTAVKELKAVLYDG